MIAFTFPTGQLQLVEDNVRRDFLSAQRGVQIRRPRGRAEHRQDDQIRQLTEQFANGRLLCSTSNSGSTSSGSPTQTPQAIAVAQSNVQPVQTVQEDTPPNVQLLQLIPLRPKHIFNLLHMNLVVGRVAHAGFILKLPLMHKHIFNLFQASLVDDQVAHAEPLSLKIMPN